jgi:hypothetical protein
VNKKDIGVKLNTFYIVHRVFGTRGIVVGWGTMLQAGRSRVRFPMRSLDFSNWPFQPQYGSGGRLSL